MIEKLCQQIASRDGYKKDYDDLSRGSSLLFLKNESPVELACVVRLLKCAATFSLSDDENYRKQAYSIAVMSRNVLQTLELENKKEIEAVITLILSRLGNFPAEKKFADEVAFDESSLPPLLRFERSFHVLQNQVSPCLDKLIVLTDFQRDLWDAMQNHKVVIVNAPTSAGKSFVLQNYVINALVSNRSNNTIYIVPSRALIEQVIIGLKGLIKKYNLIDDEIHITEVPQDYSNAKKKTIYVLTQERAQLLLESKISIDLTVADEAQNIADGARGIILQSVIELIINRNEKAKLIFAMPFVKNPDAFLSIFGLDNDYIIIPSAESPVKQNLYNILVDSHSTKKVKIEQINEEGNRHFLCDIDLSDEMSDEDRYLAVLSTTFGKGQNNIVFGSEPGKCEKLASYIMQLISKKDDIELIDFSNLLKEHIHKDFLLAETIKYGVAYHYGVLPSFIRKEIERLASEGKINYIVCTSTLLQGINLPAQNIFIMKPSKGRVDHKLGEMTSSEFWNLVGRAGRLTKDYEGNVFLVNVQEWTRKYIDENEKQQPIESAFRVMLGQENKELVHYISNYEHPSGIVNYQGYENTFMKLLDNYLSGGKDRLQNTVKNQNSDQDTKYLVEAIQVAKDRITLPQHILMLNPNVSAYRQQEMSDHMRQKIEEEGPLSLIPRHPMQKWEIIEDDYIKLFVRFGKYFMKQDKTNYLAVEARLALHWMRGASYNELLEKQIQYKKTHRKTKKEPNVNTEARDLFKKIDSKLRFEYVKFTKCYNDLLIYNLSNFQNKEELPGIPPLHLYLELGACSGTMISLIGLGMSRTSASLLARSAAKTTMDEKEVEHWLRNINLKAIDIPDTVISEVNRILA